MRIVNPRGQDIFFTERQPARLHEESSTLKLGKEDPNKCTYVLESADKQSQRKLNFSPILF
jgi:hypothetical protein